MHKDKDKPGKLSVYRYMIGSDDGETETKDTKNWEHVGHIKDSSEITDFVHKFNKKKKFSENKGLTRGGEHYSKSMPGGHVHYIDSENEQIFSHKGSHKDPTPHGVKKMSKKHDEEYKDGGE